MSTEKTWKEFYKHHKGVYSSGHFTDRDDPDARIANEYHIAYREAILRHAGKEKVAVELGCGNRPVFDVLSQFKEVWYTDISAEALEQAKNEYAALLRNAPSAGMAHFKEMNVKKFSFPDQSLEVVFNSRAPHSDETSLELFRTLKSGGLYVYQTIGEQDFYDFKMLYKGGRFYEDYLQQNLTRFGVLTESLAKGGFDRAQIQLIYDKKFNSHFVSKAEFKEKLWLLAGEDNFDSPENEAIIDEYINKHRDEQGRIVVENHRIILTVGR